MAAALEKALLKGARRVAALDEAQLVACGVYLAEVPRGVVSMLEMQTAQRQWRGDWRRERQRVADTILALRLNAGTLGDKLTVGDDEALARFVSRECRIRLKNDINGWLCGVVPSPVVRNATVSVLQSNRHSAAALALFESEAYETW